MIEGIFFALWTGLAMYGLCYLLAPFLFEGQMRINAWKRPNDWRVTIASRFGEQYGYSTWLIVAAWRALLVHIEIRRLADRRGAGG